MEKTDFVRTIKRNFVFVEIINRLPELDLPDVWIASGALFQEFWNHITDRDSEYGIRDYDVIYFDNSDLSWDAENKVIQDVATLFQDIDAHIEVRNQARVPLWFPEKFGKPYPHLKHSRQFINQFLATVCVIGLQPHKEGVHVYAPYGFTDVENMYIRPNLSSTFQPHHYLEKARRWKETWPEVEIESQGKQAYLKYCHDDGT